MKLKSATRLKGHWTIEVRKNGVLVETIEIDNQLTNKYRDSILNQLRGNAFDSLDIKYLAVGTGTTPASATDTQLATETFRSVPTSKSVENGYVQTIWVLPTYLAIQRLREIGVFAGNATATPNSGVMLSRINIDIDKTEDMEVTFIRKDYVII